MATMIDGRQCVRIAEAAQMLNYSVCSVYRLAYLHKVPMHLANGRRHLAISDLRRLRRQNDKKTAQLVAMFRGNRSLLEQSVVQLQAFFERQGVATSKASIYIALRIVNPGRGKPRVRSKIMAFIEADISRYWWPDARLLVELRAAGIKCHPQTLGRAKRLIRRKLDEQR